jgi:hypothetical protein
MKYGFMQQDIVEFYRAVFGTIALMGKEILIISLPMDRILLT